MKTRERSEMSNRSKMRKRAIGLVTLLAAAVLAVVFSLYPPAQAAAQEDGAPAGGGGRGGNKPAPGPPHDAHDLNGVWLGPLGLGGGGGAASKANTNWSKTPVSFTPAGLAQFNANKPTGGPRGVLPAFGNDPMGGANPPGLVRTFSYGGPGMNGFQFIQLPSEVVQLFSWYHYWRQIWTDGSKLPKDPDAWWYGHSTGQWSGDSFVVTTVGLDSRAWLDSWGTPFSDEMKLQEQWHRADQDNMELTLTINDPKFYTAPWSSDKVTYRYQAPGTKYAKLLEVIFAPMDEESFNEKIRDPVAGVKSSDNKK
jgi:hypothetical protein